jgi:hypothetical protein
VIFGDSIQAMLYSLHNSFAAAGYMKLFVDMLDVRANGFIADKRLFSNRL